MITVQTLNIAMELWGFFISIIIAACCLQERRPLRPRSKVFLLIALSTALLLLGDSVGLMAEGTPSHAHRAAVLVGYFVLFAMGYVVLALFTQYLFRYLEESGPVSKLPLHITRCIAVLGVLLVVISQVNHMYYVVDADNIYHRRELFWLSQAIGLVGMAVNGAFLLAYRSRLGRYNKVLLWSYTLLPMVAMTVQMFVYGIAWLNLAIVCSVVMIFIFVQLDHARQSRIMVQTISRQSDELSDSLAKLAETRVDLMRSQIQPHFIYNTLGTIGEMCLLDPQKASEMVHEFSQYLRGNFDELGLNSPIRVSREIEHVKHYTAIESVRFPDMTIRYDLHSDEFFLPALSIQPLVENSIKHGLMGLESGGSVIISTYETDKNYCVCVRDNGVGFDMNAPQTPRDRRHLGLDNIRERVQIMCGGSLTVDSAPGFGTTALIEIPKN